MRSIACLEEEEEEQEEEKGERMGETNITNNVNMTKCEDERKRERDEIEEIGKVANGRCPNKKLSRDTKTLLILRMPMDIEPLVKAFNLRLTFLLSVYWRPRSGNFCYLPCPRLLRCERRQTTIPNSLNPYSPHRGK